MSDMLTGLSEEEKPKTSAAELADAIAKLAIRSQIGQKALDRQQAIALVEEHDAAQREAHDVAMQSTLKLAADTIADRNREIEAQREAAKALAEAGGALVAVADQLADSVLRAFRNRDADAMRAFGSNMAGHGSNDVKSAARQFEWALLQAQKAGIV